MIRIIGLTGGIGSGKTTISRVFGLFGVPVFNSDDQAKKFYSQHREAASLLRDAFGKDFVKNEEIDTKAIASLVFNDDTALQLLNAIIHPWVKKQFDIWLSQQNTGVVIREAAILIESGAYKDCESIIHVTAPKELRITRTMNRNLLSREAVLSRMDNQMNDEERLKFCKYEILNDNTHLVIPQVEKIYAQLHSEAN